MKSNRKAGFGWAVAVLLASVLGMLGTSAQAKDNTPTTRTVQGKVLSQADNPLPDAVVYLTNTKSADIRTYIAGPDGGFHFSALAQNVDYEVSAKYKDHKSEVKKLSQFDGRTQVTLNLRVDVP